MTAPHCAPHNPARANRDVLLAVPIALMTFAATLTICWPLRHGESLFAALAAL